jgi:hypothetical protein
LYAQGGCPGRAVLDGSQAINNGGTPSESTVYVYVPAGLSKTGGLTLRITADAVPVAKKANNTARIIPIYVFFIMFLRKKIWNNLVYFFTIAAIYIVVTNCNLVQNLVPDFFLSTKVTSEQKTLQFWRALHTH